MSPEDREENSVPEPPAAEEETDPNLQEVEDDDATLDKLEKEGGDLAEFDLEAQIEEFRAALEEEPDNSVHHYNLEENTLEYCHASSSIRLPMQFLIVRYRFD